MPARGLARGARACALGAVTLSLAALAHAAGGGRLPPVDVLGAIVVLVAAASALVTRWRLSRTGAVALLGGGQVVLHEVLLAASSHSGGADPADGGGQPGGSPGAALTSLLTSTARHLASHQADSPIPAPAMLAAHAAATVLTGLALAHGDELLWAVWGWLQPLPAALVASVVPVSPQPCVLPPQLEILPQGVVLTEHVPRRGPPARSIVPLPIT